MKRAGRGETKYAAEGEHVEGKSVLSTEPARILSYC